MNDALATSLSVDHSNEHYVLELDNVEQYHERTTCLLRLARLNEHSRDDDWNCEEDEDKNEGHLFEEIELADDRKDGQWNFLVYWHCLK